MSQRKLRWVQFSTVGIILAMMLIYFPPYANAFVGDDYVQLDYILEFVKRPFTLLTVFNPYWLGWYYRPLQNLWFLLNRALFHYTPFGYYWLGLLVHALVIALFLRVARKLGVGWGTAVVLTIFFAIQKNYVDVVTWISAIAIPLCAFFSLAALYTYQKQLTMNNEQLTINNSLFIIHYSLPFLFFVLALLSHEEAILLPPLLLYWRWLNGKETQRHTKGRYKDSQRKSKRAKKKNQRDLRMPPAEIMMFVLMGVLVVAYLIIQFTRPNLTISLRGTGSSRWTGLFSLQQMTQFTAVTVTKFLPITAAEAIFTRYSYVVTFLTLMLLGYWFWRGNKLTRFGLAWAALHLAFIYAALWSQKPELYAGRHIYQAWMGLLLAVAGSWSRVTGYGSRVTGRRSLATGYWLLVAVYCLLTVPTVHDEQAQWMADTDEETAVRTQMQAFLPDATGLHLFAYRFPITPHFLRSVMQVWYDRDEPLPQPYGPLDRLQAYGEATSDFYLLDWDGSQIINLAPEWQAAPRTLFVWSHPQSVAWVDESGGETAVEQTQHLSVAGPDDDRRLAVKMEPPQSGLWLSQAYTLSVPDGAVLATAVRATDHTNIHFRLRLMTENSAETLFDTTITAGDETWHEVQIQLAAYAQPATFRLEIQGDGIGYWADPRLTIEN
ncbi:MAG: hypothetical protein H6662_02670 [Ardenticatenaceae bacterium]|nr:hypothetical protein [Anaerolineales bacterium]MCB8920463.1 hypothetical protein [Ardenticatenaceae bacterium]MCB8989418.1 hypothetical protein [Ardenticatenaceae bacterium]MCB9004573.1 hypothetical protein [Ardenticatenaceae bacterium]